MNRRIQDVTPALLEDGAVPVYLRCDTAIFDRIDAICFLPAEQR